MTFKKGQSGNPGGRVGVPHEFREQCQGHTQAAIENLIRWQESSHPQASVAASKEILDRAWGKSSQPLEGGLTLIIPDNRSGVVQRIVKRAKS